ncbi:hypothetical protein ACFW1A_06990 [Kitasatospora sp. NPDC058965]|uniref:hypothetical protein n=1 Tax=Kitasatospora sp. NPDC058965 TaxID=3346682 RepID=UPI0036AA7A42
MRLRHAVAASAGALLLAVTLPSSAFAAAGSFEYAFGPGPRAALHDPDGGTCLDLPEATDDQAAFAPANHTDATATVFLDFDCAGDTYYVMTPGSRLGDRLRLRSVIFS